MSNLAIEAAKRLLGTSNSSLLRVEIPIKKEEPVAEQLNEELTPSDRDFMNTIMRALQTELPKKQLNEKLEFKINKIVIKKHNFYRKIKKIQMLDC